MADITDEIKLALKNKKITFGKEKVIKMLKNGSLSKVILSTNVSEDVLKDIETYASLAEISVEKIGLSNEDLGTLCKRTHIISVLGILS